MRSAYPAVFLCALACASAPNARLSSNGTQPVAPVTLASSSAGNASVRGHIQTGSFSTEYFSGETVYDVLRRRAPIYLRARANPTAELSGRVDPIAVYLDGNFAGSLEVLQSIPAYEVVSIKRISDVEALTRFGPRHGSGALLLTLVRHD